MISRPLIRHSHLRGLWLSVAILLSYCSFANAQISAGGMPPSFSKNLPSAVPTISLPPVDVEAYLTEDAQAPKDTPYRFGAVIDVRFSLENSGEWTERADGGRIWRLRIESRGAFSIGLLYEQWYIPEGGELFIYNDDRSQVIGAFTSFNNWVDGTNITQPVAGDAIIIEYYEPAAVFGQSMLSINKVVHAYRNLFGKPSGNLDNYGDSGSCNNNVNCPEGAPWQNEKRGVAMILDGGYRICSGSLINNTNNDFTPYFLTANHCLGGETQWVFMFNYESPGCPNQNGPTNQTVANATRRANNAASDFALLQLSSNIPLSYNPYFEGWNAVDQASTNSVGIHHPSGDIKKISFDNDPAVSNTWSGTPANSHWQIQEWNDGTTEGGSSGSPLFDQNHRITGQLHGGQASCTYNFNDYYGKFSMSWNYGGSAATRLRDWLDPGNTGLLILDGIDPNQTGRIGGNVTDENSQPLENVHVGVIGSEREAYTNAQGDYLLGVQDGTYDLEFTKYGYQRVVVEDVVAVQNDTAWVDAVLPSAPQGILVGTVATQIGQGIQGAHVVIRNTPLDTLVTDSLGRFIANLPATDYNVYTVITINVFPQVLIEQDTILTVLPTDTTFATIEMFVSFIEPSAADTYGYRAYDRYDRDLPAEYEWVELDPATGHPGTGFEFPHPDSATFFAAPFPIVYYGTSYDSLTVNANGWMLPGICRDRGWRNYPIPYDASVDPPGIIAPNWADMRTGLGAQQFVWHDTAGGRWIFELANQHLAAPSNRLLNWQVHFRDPAFYPTATGDCEIVFVYGLMEYIISCTIGIEDPLENTGIQVLYNSEMNPTSWPIEQGSAIRFTTGIPTETGTVMGSLLLHPAEENITATVHVAGLSLIPTDIGTFSSSQIPAGPVSAVLEFPGYEQGRVDRIRVAADSTTQIQIEAWRLDPPRSLSSAQQPGVITLSWMLPTSVDDTPNPDVRYSVYRDGEKLADALADTFFIDQTVPNVPSVTYTAMVHYRHGHSPLSEPLVVQVLAVDDASSALPKEFALRQNYPNPFNPTTLLTYDLPQASRVKLAVFDVTGRQVAILVDGLVPAGTRTATFDAHRLATGMYIAVMDADQHRFMRKMLLLK